MSSSYSLRLFLTTRRPAAYSPRENGYVRGDDDFVEGDFCTDDQHPARTNCTACPAGKTTAGKGSTKASDCKGPPPPGSDEAAYWAPEKKKTSPGGQTEGYWQSQGYNPADVAYIMAFGMPALLAMLVVVAEMRAVLWAENAGMRARKKMRARKERARWLAELKGDNYFSWQGEVLTTQKPPRNHPDFFHG